jgi:hypothetical protein
MPFYSTAHDRGHPFTGVCLLLCVVLCFSAPSSFSCSLGQCEFHRPFPEKASFRHCSFLIFSGFIVAVAT